jgi:hypothetical protein
MDIEIEDKRNKMDIEIEDKRTKMDIAMMRCPFL